MDMVRQFQIIRAVIEKGSLGKASESLRISQPALTKSVRRLEERLGVPLFYRDSKGMRPTIYGETLVAHAQEITVGVQQALRDIESLRDGTQGTIRVAAGPLVTSEILSNAVVSLMREQPRLRVNIHSIIGDTRAELIAGNYDFILALLQPGPPPSGLLQRPIFADRIAVIARRNHPLTRLARVNARDLSSATWVLPPAGHYHRRQLENTFEAAGLSAPAPAVECDSTSFIMSIVSQTDHLGVIARMGLLKNGIGTDWKVSEIPLKSPFMVRPIGVVWRKHHILSQASHMLIDAIGKVCVSMQDTVAGGAESGPVLKRAIRRPQ